MVRFPNCKINIGLYITNRRADGYHDLETVFYPIPLYDALEIVPATKTTLYLSGKTIDGYNDTNLVWKAYQLMKSKFPDTIKEVDIYLQKSIPMGAGLGGGSGDGAAMLLLLNEYFELGLNTQQLSALALPLGSDCPFFIYNTPQFAKGRGEHMKPVSLDISKYSIQLICPQVHVATADAFKMIQPKAAPFDLQKIHELPVTQWKEYISNDFELPVFSKYPLIREITDRLYHQGAIYASMTGSGSTVYGIFSKGNRATISTDIQFEEHYIE